MFNKNISSERILQKETTIVESVASNSMGCNNPILDSLIDIII
jgi:hypothetical protein